MESIFKEIVHIMHHDYAGWKDKAGWDDPAYYLKKLKDSEPLNNEDFTQLVKEYLLDYKEQHIIFKNLRATANKSGNRGFKVRRFEDRLYVTETTGEQCLKKGWAFISLGGCSIPELKTRHAKLLDENHPERENWLPILSLYDDGEIEDEDGQVRIVSFNFYDKEDYIPEYSVKQLNETTLLMTMTDFANPDAIQDMAEKNHALLNTAEDWIIDVRVNYGGSDLSYYCLLPYLMPVKGAELADKEERILFNCTEANAERQLAGLAEQMKRIQDEQALSFLYAWEREWERNKGRGFVEFNFDEFIPDTFVKGLSNPKKVIVLADVYCGSAGDSFVEYCKKSTKVTVIGRATSGLNDYANLAVKSWEEGFELWYPTSRLSRIDQGRGMTGKGIEPHIRIPWTPAHIKRDIDLETALSLLEMNIIIEENLQKFTK
jgi:hypothetical protein